MAACTLGTAAHAAQTQVARIAITQHLRAACVASQVPAECATTFRCQAERKQKAGLVSSLLHVLKNTTGVCGEGGVGRIKVTHFVHALQIDHDFTPRSVGCRTHHQTGVTPLRHHGYAGGSACFDHSRHFESVARSHHAQRTSVFAPAPVTFIRGQAFTGEHMGVTGDESQTVNQSVHA